VVSAASTLASRGLGELTMSSLATELGVTPMAVYRHVDNKEHLLNLVLQHALENVEVPPLSAGTWRERITRLHCDITDVMITYPGLQWGLHAVSVGATERLLEAYLSILLDAGFDEVTAIEAYTGLYYLAIGVVTHAEHASVWTPAAEIPRAPESNPIVARLRPRAVALEPSALRAFALDTYLDGLEARLAPRGRQKRALKKSS
jgi:AcrR family transcriptional regulator